MSLLLTRLQRIPWPVLWTLAAAITFLVYLFGLPGYWAFDDYNSILHNNTLHFRSLDWPHLAAILFSGPGLLHRPLSMFTFYLDARWFGIEPLPFKLTNILIHILAGFCLWLMARQLLRLAARREPRLSPATIHGLSFTATALWLVHPLNLTAVLYVVQRETALSAIFTALAIWTYLLGRQRQLESRKNAWPFIWLLTPFLTFVGLLCKENAALVPVFLFVVEFSLLEFENAKRRWNLQLTAFFIVFLVIPAGAVLWLLFEGTPFFLGGYIFRNFTLTQRLLTESRVMFDYLSWIFLPNISQLGLYHDDVIISRGLLNPLATLLALAGLAGLLGFAWWGRKRWRWLSFAIVWFLGGQLMESTFIPLELVFEHRNYLPMFGVILGMVVTADMSLRSLHRPKLSVSFAVLAGIVLAVLTALRASSWSSPLNFAITQVVHHPNSPRANYELGIIYVALATSGAPQFAPLAETAMLRSRALTPGSLTQDAALAIMYTNLNRPDKAAQYLEDAAQRALSGSFSAQTQTSLASLAKYADGTHMIPFELGDRVFRNVLKNPRTRENACYTADLWNTYGIFLQNHHDFPESVRVTAQAVSLCPDSIGIRINYALDMLQMGNAEATREQIAVIEKANWFGRYSLVLYDLYNDLNALKHPSAVSTAGF